VSTEVQESQNGSADFRFVNRSEFCRMNLLFYRRRLLCFILATLDFLVQAGIRSAPLSRTCIVKAKDFAGTLILIATLSVVSISSGGASDESGATHLGKITKTRAERIALTKVHGGTIRSAELESANGHRFWSVYIAKPGSKNAREIRVDARNGHILAVQTERPEDQAEEPPKVH
jgi:hypothetical protein